MAKSQVMVIGDACVDMVIRLPDHKSDTPDLKNSVPQLQGGGSAANVSVALVRLGVDVAMAGTVGDDGYGSWVRDELSREGVNVQGVVSARNAFTPMVIALIEPGGERLIYVWPHTGGAHVQLQKNNIDQELLTSVSWMHTSGICLRESPARESVLYSMKKAHEKGVTVSLDLNLRLESWDLSETTRRTFEQAVDLSDIVFGNGKEEIMPFTNTDSTEDGAKYLCNGKNIIVARQGKKGVLVVTPNEKYRVSAFKTQVVDTLGAGDAFNGGFIAACLAGNSVKEAARWGNAVAALKIGKTGARGLPCLEDVKQVLG